MQIVCPHCSTSYAVDPAALGSGRTVRCARCKEQWFAQAQEMVYADAAASPDAPADGGPGPASMQPPIVEATPVASEYHAPDAPMIASPSIAAEFPIDADIEIAASREIPSSSPPRKKSKVSAIKPPMRSGPLNLRLLCAAMSLLVAAGLMFRTEIVRLLPQTASFYAMIGQQVNLREMAFKDLKLTSETVEGKPVLVIEGYVLSQSRKPLEVPRLRFAVSDKRGQEIYAWNAILDEAVLQPGDKAFFRSRLADPPSEGSEIDVRFFNKRDLAAVGGKS